MRELGGGLVVVRHTEVLESLPLPIAGVAGLGTSNEMADELRESESATRAIGCQLSNPFLSLDFASLPGIPYYGITDRGWYDIGSDRLVNVVLKGRE